MDQVLTAFVAAFIPIFVAIDAPGILPMYLGLTDGLTNDERREVAFKAIVVAGVIGGVFVFAGKAIFHFLGITRADFQIAGGLVLLVLALSDLLSQGEKRRRAVSKDIAIVPLGMPLIVGPGALTALVALTDQQGIFATASAFVVNLAIALGFLAAAPRIVAVIGQGGSKALSKVMNLLLAAIAVSMVRVGVTEVVRAAHAI